jgi:hypothetical protein
MRLRLAFDTGHMSDVASSQSKANGGVGIVRATDAVWRGSLRPMNRLPQIDFRPAEAHCNPSGYQLQHELA